MICQRIGNGLTNGRCHSEPSEESGEVRAPPRELHTTPPQCYSSRPARPRTPFRLSPAPIGDDATPLCLGEYLSRLKGDSLRAAAIVRLGWAGVNADLASGRRRSRTGEATEVGSGVPSGDAYSSLMRDIICCFSFSGMLARSML